MKHQNVGVYNRVKKMVGHKARLFFVFANEHHIDTYQQVFGLRTETLEPPSRFWPWL